MFVVAVYVSEDMKQVHVKKYYDLVMINSLNRSLTNAIKFVPMRKFPFENCCTVEFNSFVNCIVPWKEMGGFIYTLLLIVSFIFFECNLVPVLIY